MSQDLPTLSHTAARLLAAERDVIAAPTGARARVLSRVQATVGPAPPGGGGAGGAGPAPVGAVTGSGAAGAQLVWIAAATVLLGAGAVWLGDRAAGVAPAAPVRASAAAPTAPTAAPPAAAATRPAPVPNSVAVASPIAAPAPPPAAPAPVLAAASAPAPATTAPPLATASPSHRPAPPRADPSAERDLLEGARWALGRGEVSTAIAKLRRHRQRYPRGALVEERESLWIKALVDDGRIDDAKRRASRFERRFPDSIHRPAITALVAR